MPTHTVAVRVTTIRIHTQRCSTFHISAPHRPGGTERQRGAYPRLGGGVEWLGGERRTDRRADGRASFLVEHDKWGEDQSDDTVVWVGAACYDPQRMKD